jgi:hypothetical protein
MPTFNTIYRQRSLTAEKASGLLFVVASLNPWTSFRINSMDSQPWPVLSGLLFLTLVGSRLFIPKNFLIFVFAIVVGVFSAIWISLNDAQGIPRAIVSYITMGICYVAFFNFLVRYGFPKKTFIIVGILWLLIGITEVFTPTFSEILSPARTTSGRGVTSLAPEPTFFGIYLFFSSWLILVSQNYQPKGWSLFLCISNLLAIVLLAKSSMVLVYLVVSGAVLMMGGIYFILKKLSIKKKILVLMLTLIAIIIIFIIVFGGALYESRMYKLIQIVLDSNSMVDILLLDASVSQRVEAVVFSIHGFIYNYMMPGGFSTFLTTRDELSIYWGDLFWWPTAHNKIMSFTGATLYELGLFGAIALAALFLGAQSNAMRLREAAIIFIIMLSAIPLAFPLVPMLFALWNRNSDVNLTSRSLQIPQPND